MAKIQISPVALPPSPLLKFKTTSSPYFNVDESEMTPFSAVTPARFLAVYSSKIQVHEVSLDTIYEEEIYLTSTCSSSSIRTTSTSNTGKTDDNLVKMTAFKPSPTSHLLSSSSATCFLQVRRSFSAVSTFRGRSKFQCAN
ncbi:hypothetical protein CsatA_023964 [Cannabis sativa]